MVILSSLLCLSLFFVAAAKPIVCTARELRHSMQIVRGWCATMTINYIFIASTTPCDAKGRLIYATSKLHFAARLRRLIAATSIGNEPETAVVHDDAVVSLYVSSITTRRCV